MPTKPGLGPGGHCVFCGFAVGEYVRSKFWGILAGCGRDRPWTAAGEEKMIGMVINLSTAEYDFNRNGALRSEPIGTSI